MSAFSKSTNSACLLPADSNGSIITRGGTIVPYAEGYYDDLAETHGVERFARLNQWEGGMIRFEFNGGPKDGEIVVHDGGSGKGKAYAELTEDGRPGKILWCTTDYFMDVAEHLSDSALRDLSEAGVPLRGHLYEARVRWHLNPGFRVKLRHVGVCPSLERRTDVLQDNNSILESL